MMTETDFWTAAFENLDVESPVHALRTQAFDRFNALPFPTLRDEDWKYTSVKAIARSTYCRASEYSVTREQIAPFLLTESNAHQLVFINGRFSSQYSTLDELPAGVTVMRLADAIAQGVDLVDTHLGQHAAFEKQKFTALNTAFMEDGLYVSIAKNVEFDQPIHVLYVTVPDAKGNGQPMTHVRNLIAAAPFSKVTVVESYAGLGDAPYLTTAVTEMVVAENATVDHYKVGREGPGAQHIGWLQVNQEKSSTITSHNFSIGGSLVRNNVNGSIDAEGCDVTFNGLTLASGTQHIDNHLWIDHLKPHCNSWEYYKSVLDDEAKSIFAGRIYVAEDAQKTDAKQTSMNLLLSNTAQAYTKPQLEIFADDVKCTHGATIGQLDDDHMFYLNARGISRAAARSLLIFAFANENIQEVKIAELRDKLEQLLLNRLPQKEILEGGL